MRLIDAVTLKAEFTGNFKDEYNKAEIHALIDLAPTIAQPKEQEPKTVLHMAERSVIPVKALSGFCPKCNHVLIYGMNKHFCGNCGREVKWK